MTQALSTLLELAERERDGAQQRLAQAEQAVSRLQQQQQQLQTYRREYDERAPARGGRAAPIELLRCHQGFMHRLDGAVVQQQGHLRQAEARLPALREALLAAEMRVAAVRKLIERREAEQRGRAARQDQRRTDEAAQQRHWRAQQPDFGVTR